MKTRFLATLGTCTAVGSLAAAPALAEAGPGGSWGHPGMMGGGWIIGPLMMLLMLGLIVAVVVLVLRWLGGTGGDLGGNAQRPNPTARRILEERFARGEIDEEEFRKRKKALEE